MKYISFFLFALLLCRPLPAEMPRLTVILVVDQLRADVFERTPELDGGLSELAKNGARFPNVHLRHIPTETAPGHAAIATGRPPSVHGIIGNDWYDRKAGKTVTAVMPAGDEIISARQLKAPTLADVLKAHYPGSRVVTIAVKERSSLMLGGQKPDVAIWYDSDIRAFTGIGEERLLSQMTAFETNKRARVKTKALSKKDLRLFYSSTTWDSYVLGLAEEAIREWKLGSSPGLDMLCISLSATDYLGHEKGPDHADMKAHLQSLDDRLKTFLDTLRSSLDGRVVIALTSDHGVLPVPESPQGKAMGARRFNQKSWKADLEKSFQKRFPRPGNWIKALDLPNVHLNRPVGARDEDWRRTLWELARTADGIPSVARTYLPPDFPQKDEFTPIYQRSYHPERSGDLVLRLKPGVLVTTYATGTSHGSPYDYDVRVPLILYGNGIRAGVYPKTASTEDIAPTLGRLLALPFNPAPDGGRVLTEALSGR